ncbi:MAG: MBL fold metallo-hydrolase [Candidatus Margulisiibacteriota bacterium]
MLIKTIKVGPLRTNCYVVADEKNGEAIVIDPGDDAAEILPEIKGLKVLSIVVTHGHMDHFGAVSAIKQETGAPLLMHPSDNWFILPDQNIGNEIVFGSIKLEVIPTPGHSQGSFCLYTKGFLFSGDTLFADTYGRTDLPGGSEADMVRSLKRLAQLPPDTRVFPGHGKETSIALEKERGTLE